MLLESRSLWSYDTTVRLDLCRPDADLYSLLCIRVAPVQMSAGFARHQVGWFVIKKLNVRMHWWNNMIFPVQQWLLSVRKQGGICAIFAEAVVPIQNDLTGPSLQYSRSLV